MSNFDRFKRVIKSWTGNFKKHREHAWQYDDPKMILNELGLQMSPETLDYLISNDVRLQHFLDQVYQTEEDLDLDLVVDNTAIDPRLQPEVHEGEGKAIFTIRWKGDEVVFAEFDLPWLAKGQDSQGEEEEDEDGGTINIEIE